MLTPLAPETVKVGEKILRAIVVDAFKLPYVPVTVKVYCPTATELLAVSVSKLDPLVGLGLHDAVTPLGRPVTARFALPVKPYSGFT
jgi:hypothetical protein